MIIAQYTASASGVVPRFDPNCVYTANEIDNGNGTYTVTLTADNDFTYVDFNDSNNLLSVEYLKVTNKVTHLQETFNGCELLTSINASDWDTSNIEDMDSTFCFCYSLNTITGIENWNTNSLTALYYTFCDCRALTSLNLSNWNTSNVTAAEQIFCDCASLTELDIRNWDLSNAGSDIESMITYYEFEPKLKVIKCNNPETILGMVPTLPDRNSEETGIIITDNTSEINTEELVDLNWKVAGLIAKYKYYKPTLDIDMDSIMYQIPEPITFDGSGYIDTGIQLLKDDSDWTLFLECIPNIDNKTQTVIHCVDENNASYPGISFSFEPNGCLNIWDGTNGTVIGDGYYLNKKVKIAIVKKDNNIIVYHNYSSSIYYQEDYPITIPYTFKSANSTLSIGGGHIGTSAINTFSGVINNFVIYNKALESEDCESIIRNDPRPIFNNNDFNYTIEDKYLDTDDEDIITRSIYAATDFTSCRFEGENGLATVEYLKVTNKVTTMDSMFYNCFNMTSVNANGWDTSNVTSMIETFSYCCHLEEITGIENWDTSSLTNLACTFNCCCVSLISLNLSSWDTSKVTNMYGTFGYCCNLEEIIGIENWDTSSVTDLSSIFECCEWLTSLDLSKWDTSKVTNMCETFCWCCRLEEIIGIENWDTSSLEDLTYTFMCCESLTSLNLSSWNTSNVIYTDETFSDCTYLEELDISNWDLSNADPDWMSKMFYISELDPNNTDYYDPNFKPYLKTIKCNNANTISLIAPYLQDRSTCEEVGKIITDNVSEVNAGGLVNSNWKVTSLIAQYKFDKSIYDNLIPEFNAEFANYTIEDEYLDAENENIVTRSIFADTDFTSCSFNGATGLLTVEHLKVTNKVTSTAEMFYNCGSLTSVNAIGWDTSNVTEMCEMFYNCSYLEEIIGIENWNTSSLEDLTYTFMYCKSLTSLNLSGWNTNNVTLADETFSNCTKLEELDIKNWDLSNADVDCLSGIFYVSELDPDSNLYDSNFKPYLKTITCNNANTISLIAPYLPDRKTCDEAGVMTTNVTGLNITTLASKNWGTPNSMLVAKYTFDKSVEENLIPTFNNNFNYAIKDEYLDTNQNIVTRSIYSDADFTSCRFVKSVDGKVQQRPSLLTVEYLKITDKVTSLFELFRGCYNLTKVDTTGWDTSNVTTMQNTFYNCGRLETNLNNLNTSKVTNMNGMFSYAATDAVQGLEDLDVSKVTNFGFMFYGATSTELDLSKWDMSSATTFYVMFTICNKLKSLKVSTWNTSKVTSMNAVFWYTDALKKLDISGWTSDKCTNMSQLFGHMWALEELDLGNLKIIDNVTEFFIGNANLKRIYTSNLETVMKLPGHLPDRTGKDTGEIVTNVSKNGLDEDMLATYSAKNWKLVPGTLVAKYTFDKTITENLVPVFNNDFVDYVIEDEYLDTDNKNIVTRCVYSVIHEDFSFCKFNEAASLLSIEYLRVTNKVTNMNQMFFNCNNLTSINTDKWDTSKVIDMSSMFYNCSSLAELNVNNLNTDLVQNLSYAFRGCLLTKLNISNWNVGNVIDMSYMFYGCSLLTTIGNVSNWNTGEVINMQSMFHGCSSFTTIGDISNWNTEKVTNMQSIFRECSSLSELSLKNWNVSAVTNMGEMFDECPNLRKVTCDNSATINKIIDELPIRPESNPGEISTTCRESDINIEDLSNKYWLYKLRGLVARYTCNTSGILPTFNNGYIYNKVDEVDNGDGTYTVTIFADTDFTSCNFSGRTELLSVEYLKVTNKVTNLGGMFQNCSSLTKVNTADWNTSSVTKMTAMCWNCSKLTEIDVSNFNTSNVTTLYIAFCNCSSLLELNTSKWNLNKVTSLEHAFQNCSKLTEIDASNWGTNSLETAFSVFHQCYNLTTIKGIDKWNMSNVTEIGKMFAHCTSLTELDLGNWTLKADVRSSEGSIFAGGSLLKITVNNNILLKIGELLPSRVGKEQGLVVCKQIVTGIDTSSIEAKNWMVEFGIVIAKYTSKSIGLRPTFNAGYNYTVVREELVDGVYEIELKSEEHFTSFSFQGKTDLLAVDYLNITHRVGSFAIVFNGCSSLTRINASNWDTSKVGTFNAMFTNCSKLTEIDVSNWDVSGAMYMYNVFANCTSLTAINGLGNWKTDSLSSTHYMFYNCASLTEIDVSNWNMSKVGAMNDMFSACKALTSLDLSNWNTGNVTNMSAMFNNCWSLTTIGDVSNWNTSKVTSMANLFSSCDKLTSLDISNWNTGKVTNMNWMFYSCKSLTSLDLSNWDTSNVTSMYYMFGRSNLTSLDASNWNTEKVADMREMFRECKSLTSLYISNWNTSNVPDMNYMFKECQSLTSLDLSNWDTSKVTNMTYMFQSCSNLISLDVKNWDVSKVTNMKCMFNSCIKLTSLDVKNWNPEKVTDMYYMFQNCQSLTSLDMSNWNVSNVTNMDSMFSNCKSLTTIGDVKNLDTSKVTNMTYMFKSCESLISLDASNWKTGELTNLAYTFNGCLSLTKLDLRNWDVRKVTSMNYFIQTCPALVEIYVNNWDTSSVVNMSAAFNNLKSLKTLDLSSFNVSTATNISYMFNMAAFEELNISGWKLNENTITTGFITSNNANLITIILKNSDSFTVNKVIEAVADRKGKTPGDINVAGIDDISQVNMDLAKTKNWIVRLVKPGPRELESMIFNKKTSSGNKINSKHNNGHVIRIIYNK